MHPSCERCGQEGRDSEYRNIDGITLCDRCLKFKPAEMPTKEWAADKPVNHQMDVTFPGKGTASLGPQA